MDSKTSLPFTSTCNRQSSLFEGTDVILDGISKDAIEEAKGNFIRYSDVEQLEATRFGNVYRVADGESAAVYVTGLKVAEEENSSRTTSPTRRSKSEMRSIGSVRTLGERPTLPE